MHKIKCVRLMLNQMGQIATKSRTISPCNDQQVFSTWSEALLKSRWFLSSSLGEFMAAVASYVASVNRGNGKADRAQVG